MTTLDPGDSVVLIYGRTFNPFSTAFFASKPAANNDSGLDVFVQEVIAVRTISPCLIV